MHKEEQRVADVANHVLAREARARADSTGEPFDEALEAVLGTEAGRQLGDLRDGPHGGKGARQWQEELPRVRAEERSRARKEEVDRAKRDAVWESFIRTERRELELRRDGQLSRLLGEPLPGEPAAVLKHLTSEDKRQAEDGLVALTSNGKVSYKRLEELCEGDIPAREAARRLRTTWLKERSDGWLARGAG